MKSYAQAGQDLYVNAVLGGKRNGLFIDIGCSHPTSLSNTYALEQERGWRGILVDSDADSIALCLTERASLAIQADARTIDWKPLLADIGPVVDYASVDIDQWTYAALNNLLEHGPMIRVLTVEHDFYARGDSLRIPNRELLAAKGYEIIAADVHSNGCCYEDWLVDPRLVDMRLVERFRSAGLDWADVLRKGGAL